MCNLYIVGTFYELIASICQRIMCNIFSEADDIKSIVLNWNVVLMAAYIVENETKLVY